MPQSIRRLLLPVAVLMISVTALAGSVADASHGDPSYSYIVRNFASLGGSESAGISVNNRNWVAGYSNNPDDMTRHATLWIGGLKFDLGTLGGPNSSVLWPVENDSGMIVGISETDEVDPLDENWSCYYFFPAGTDRVCRGFAWERGEMKAMPTLGGTHSFAAGTNNRGQVVGWAENEVHDPTCTAPQVLQFRAVLWEPRSGDLQELPPLPGDTVSSATAINDKGQIVGISGICSNAVGGLSAAHAVLWENGEVKEIGDLGGVAWNTPMAINNNGAVVGFSNISADDGATFNAQAFIWTEEDGIQNLGTLPGDTNSQALGINNRGQVVGMSCGEDGCSAFLWEDGVMTDLNTLIGPTYPGHLAYANDINERGAITGQASDPVSGDLKAFLAVPLHSHGNDAD